MYEELSVDKVVQFFSFNWSVYYSPLLDTGLSRNIRHRNLSHTLRKTGLSRHSHKSQFFFVPHPVCASQLHRNVCNARYLIRDHEG